MTQKRCSPWTTFPDPIALCLRRILSSVLTQNLGGRVWPLDSRRQGSLTVVRWSKQPLINLPELNITMAAHSGFQTQKCPSNHTIPLEGGVDEKPNQVGSAPRIFVGSTPWVGLRNGKKHKNPFISHGRLTFGALSGTLFGPFSSSLFVISSIFETSSTGDVALAMLGPMKDNKTGRKIRPWAPQALDSSQVLKIDLKTVENKFQHQCLAYRPTCLACLIGFFCIHCLLLMRTSFRFAMHSLFAAGVPPAMTMPKNILKKTRKAWLEENANGRIARKVVPERFAPETDEQSLGLYWFGVLGQKKFRWTRLECSQPPT